MGLDQYAYVCATRPDQPVGFKQPEDADQFHYWRKHPDLHGWMEQLWLDKGGAEVKEAPAPGWSAFNCTPVALDLEDLDALEHAVRKRSLPRTTGFFFGTSKLDDDEIADDLAFIVKARAYLKQGLTVYYTSWW